MKPKIIEIPTFWIRRLAYICCCLVLFLGTPTAAFSSTKEEIRLAASKIVAEYEAGEISEAVAMSRLGYIEKEAELLSQTSSATSTLEVPLKTNKVEAAIGTSLVRMAALPELSLWEWFWVIARPILLGLLGILACLWFFIGYIGTQKLEIWSRKLAQVYQDKRNLYFPASRTTIPENRVPPLPSGRNTHHVNRAHRHSGEVPDELT